ncbi:MAG: SpoIIE family protein phosphatase [Firmicutes bacterium]|nr:SpoIIE family protein phosphatase [Bacillota bacterium]
MSDLFKNMKIRTKLIAVIMLVAVGTLLLSYLGLYGMMENLRGQVEVMYNDVAATVSNSTTNAMLNQAEDALKTLASVQTESTDRSLKEIASSVGAAGDFVEELYANPGAYGKSPYEVRPKSYNNPKELCALYMMCGGVPFTDEAARELNLLSYAQAIFQAEMEENSTYDGFYIGTESGIAYVYSAGQNYSPDYVAKERNWYKLAMSDPGNIVWTETYVDPFGDTYVTAARTIAGPDGSIKGVVACDIFFNIMAEEILADGLGDTGTTFLLGENLDFISYEVPDGGEFEASFDAHFSDPARVRQSLKTNEGKAFFAVLDGNEMYIAASTVPETGWTLCTAIKRSEVVEPMDKVSSQTEKLVDTHSDKLRTYMSALIIGLIMSFVIIALVVSLIGYFLARTITNPLRNLSEQVSSIGAGDFDSKIVPSSNDETGELASKFNEMQDSLKSYVENLQAVTAEKEKIGAELNVAQNIQADMLPRIFPPFPEKKNIMLYASMDPAREVGGDFYDFFLIDDDHLAFVIADVSGKSVPAALFMVISKTLIKNRAMQGGTPAQILMDVNTQLAEGNEAEMFVTCWLGICDLTTGHVIAANAGHEYPAIAGADGHFEFLKDKHGLVLAAFPGMKYTDYEFNLEKGGGFFVYTDGVPETTNSSSELFGMDRLRDALNGKPWGTPKDLLANVSDSAYEFAGDAPQFDDMTMIGFVWLGREGEIAEEELNKQEIVLSADVRELEKLNDFLADQAQKFGCPPATLMKIQISCEEIFTNIANYAYPDGNGTAEVISQVTEEDGSAVMTVQFSDSGVPFDPLAMPDPDVTASAEERDIGGLGIFMVKETMDKVDYRYENGRNILTISKIINDKKRA